MLTHRESKVTAFRDSGMTFREIGQQLGVSPSRASQIFAKADMKRRYVPPCDGSIEMLLCDAFHCPGIVCQLRRLGITTLDELDAVSDDWLMQYRCIGPARVAAMRQRADEVRGR